MSAEPPIKSPAVVPAANPFYVASREVNAGTVSIEEQRAIAEVQGKLIIAKRFPRNTAEAFQKVMTACSRFGLADAAMYSYAKGGTSVSGPSIRLAEELARSMGNIEFGIRELSQKNGVSEMQAFAWDLETNTQSVKNFTVKHERHTKTGVKALTDPRDIYELTANQGGRRLRACILAIMPPDLVEAAVEQCRKTLQGQVAANPEDSKRKLILAFQELGVTVQHLQENRGKTVADFLPDDVVELRSIYRTIRDGHASAAEFFGKAEPLPVEQLTASPATPAPPQVKSKPKPADFDPNEVL